MRPAATLLPFWGLQGVSSRCSPSLSLVCKPLSFTPQQSDESVGDARSIVTPSTAAVSSFHTASGACSRPAASSSQQAPVLSPCSVTHSSSQPCNRPSEQQQQPGCLGASAAQVKSCQHARSLVQSQPHQLCVSDSSRVLGGRLLSVLSSGNGVRCSLHSNGLVRGSNCSVFLSAAVAPSSTRSMCSTMATTAPSLMAAIRNPSSYEDLEKLVSQSYCEDTFNALTELIKAEMNDMSGRELSNALWLYASSVHDDPQLVVQVLEHTYNKLGEMDMQDLSNALWGAADQQVYVPEWVSAACTFVYERLHEASLRQLVAVTGSLAAFGHYEDDYELFDAIAEAAIKLLPGGDPVDIVLLLKAFSVIQHKHTGLFEAALAHLQSKNLVAALPPWVLAELTWACAIQGHRDDVFLKQASELVATWVGGGPPRRSKTTIAPKGQVLGRLMGNEAFRRDPLQRQNIPTGSSSSSTTTGSSSSSSSSSSESMVRGPAPFDPTDPFGARRTIFNKPRPTPAGLAPLPTMHSSSMFPWGFNPMVLESGAVGADEAIGGTSTPVPPHVREMLAQSRTDHSGAAAAPTPPVASSRDLAKVAWSIASLAYFHEGMVKNVVRCLQRVDLRDMSHQYLAWLGVATLKAKEVQPHVVAVPPQEAESIQSWMRLAGREGNAMPLPDNVLALAFAAAQVEDCRRKGEIEGAPVMRYSSWKYRDAMLLGRPGLKASILKVLGDLGIVANNCMSTIDGALNISIVLRMSHPNASKGQLVAVEPLGPLDCMRNPPYDFTGPVVTKFRSLHRRGWWVLPVPYHIWGDLEERGPGDAGRREWLAAKLAELQQQANMGSVPQVPEGMKL